MAGNIKDLIVKIMVDDAEVEKFQKAGQKSLEFGNVLDKSAVASAGALALLAGGAFAAGDAAAEAQQSQMQLQFALDQFPATADTNAEKLYALNSALALKTKYDDDAYASGQAVLAQYGLTGAQLEQLTPLLGDYAAKTGADIPTAAEQLGKALLGQGRALKSVGIDFTDAGSVGANYDQIIAGLSSQVGGFAEVQGQTASGANAIFKNSIGELLEQLGQGLLPIMVQVAQTGRDVMGWMQENSQVVIILASAIGVIASGILILAAGMKVWAAVQAVQTAMQWANNAAWLASPVTWIILAIIVAIGLLVAAGIWLYNNWDAVIAWFGDAWAAVCAWFQDVGNGIAVWWNDLWSGISSFFSGVWDGIVGFFKGALDWVVQMFLDWTVYGLIIKNWGAISDFFVGLWDGIVGIFKGAWNGIIGWLESGINGGIDLLNGLFRGINGIGGAFGINIALIPHVNIPRLATGGIAMTSTLANIGEAGPEAVIPLNSQRGRDLLDGGNRGPMELGDRTIDKLAKALAAILRVQDRKGVAFGG